MYFERNFRTLQSATKVQGKRLRLFERKFEDLCTELRLSFSIEPSDDMKKRRKSLKVFRQLYSDIKNDYYDLHVKKLHFCQVPYFLVSEPSYKVIRKTVEEDFLSLDDSVRRNLVHKSLALKLDTSCRLKDTDKSLNEVMKVLGS